MWGCNGVCAATGSLACFMRQMELLPEHGGLLEQPAGRISARNHVVCRHFHPAALQAPAAQEAAAAALGNLAANSAEAQSLIASAGAAIGVCDWEMPSQLAPSAVAIICALAHCFGRQSGTHHPSKQWCCSPLRSSDWAPFRRRHPAAGGCAAQRDGRGQAARSPRPSQPRCVARRGTGQCAECPQWHKLCAAVETLLGASCSQDCASVRSAALPPTPPEPTRCPPAFPGRAAGRDTQNKLATATAGGIPLLVSLMAGAEGASDGTRQAAASALRCAARGCCATAGKWFASAEGAEGGTRQAAANALTWAGVAGWLAGMGSVVYGAGR